MPAEVDVQLLAPGLGPPRRDPPWAAVRRLREHAGAAWLVAVTALLVVFVYRNGSDLGDVFRTIRGSRVGWSLLAVAVVAATHAGIIAVFRTLLAGAGARVPWRAVGQAHAQRVAVGTLSPVPGPGLFAYTRALKPAGISTEDAVLSLALHSLLGYGSFVLYLLPVILLLAAERDLPPLLAGAAALLALVFCAFAAGAAALLRPGGPPSLMRRLPARVQTLGGGLRGRRVRRDAVASAFVLSLAVDILGACLLFVSLRAVGASPGLTTAAAAYGVSTVFVLISPFFSGIGFVELGTVAALKHFDVSTDQAVAATVLFRAGELWLPLAASLVVEVGSRRQVRDSSLHVPALLVLFAGFASVTSVVAPHIHTRLNRAQDYSALDLPELSRSFVLVAGCLLMYLAWGLWRRRRTAWFAGVVLLAVTIPAHLLKDHDGAAAVISIVALAFLLVHARKFNVPSDTPSIRQGVVQFVLVLGFALAYGTLGFLWLDLPAFGREFSVHEAATHALRSYFLLDSGLHAHTRYGAWFLDSLSVVGGLSAIVAATSLGRPLVARSRVQPWERQAARELIQRAGDSSLDFFKYAGDKRFFLSSDGRAVIAYGVSRGAAVALGDPVAESDDAFAEVLRGFLAMCRSNGWQPAFHQASDRYHAEYRRAGLSWVKVGEEAVVDLDRFSLAGGAMKSLRSNANRLTREGYRVAFYEPPLDQDLVEALREISDEWLRLGRHRERRFTLGHFSDDYVRESPVFVVQDETSRVYAFANLIPDGVPGEATIDLMRRRSRPDGAMDFLFTGMFEQLRARGFHRFSLGMAPFAQVGVAPGASVIEQSLHLLYEHGDRIFSYRGLRTYKDKFHPEWEPRFLVFDSELHLPTIVLGLAGLSE